MSLARSVLVRALAALLLLQWAGAPAHCLAMAALSLDAGVLCHAEPDAPSHPGNPAGGALSPDQACPACHALGHLALPVAADALPQRITWSTPAPPAPPIPTIATARRAPPQQPRAPPEPSV